jgi:ribosomal-protein-alanine N-acetyltransferase
MAKLYLQPAVMHCMGASVRTYASTDFHAVRALEKGDKRENYSAAVFVRQAAEIFPATFFVAGAKSEVFGYAIGAQVQGNPAIAWVLRLKVKEESQGRGIGTVLMETLIAALTSAGAREILLSVSPVNRPAVSLYRKLGFIKTGYHPAYFGEGEERDVMRLLVMPAEQ